MKELRKALTKRQRFEVFKRDSFTCQYCGQSAPDVILEADHIKPVSKGGTNSITNLVTACYECNRGKSSKSLSDDSVVKKQMSQLKALQERKHQIEMVGEWAESLLNNDEIDQINKIIGRISNSVLTEAGEADVRKFIKKYGFKTVIGSLPGAYERYDDEYINNLGTYLRYEDASEEDRHFMYSVGILRNRLEKMGQICHYNSQVNTSTLKHLRSLGLCKDFYRNLVLNFSEAYDYFGAMSHQKYVLELKNRSKE